MTIDNQCAEPNAKVRKVSSIFNTRKTIQVGRLSEAMHFDSASMKFQKICNTCHPSASVLMASLVCAWCFFILASFPLLSNLCGPAYTFICVKLNLHLDSGELLHLVLVLSPFLLSFGHHVDTICTAKSKNPSSVRFIQDIDFQICE